MGFIMSNIDRPHDKASVDSELLLPIDRAAQALDPRNTLRDAINLMTDSHQTAIPILNEDGSYLGMCTVRRIADLCLPIAASLLMNMPTTAFFRDTLDGARRRLYSRLDESVISFIDRTVTAIGPKAPT